MAADVYPGDAHAGVHATGRAVQPVWFSNALDGLLIRPLWTNHQSGGTAAWWIPMTNRFSFASSLMPGADSTPLLTSTRRAPVCLRASPIFSGFRPPARIQKFFVCA